VKASKGKGIDERNQDKDDRPEDSEKDKQKCFQSEE
jgi:hypothetical protein